MNIQTPDQRCAVLVRAVVAADWYISVLEDARRGLDVGTLDAAKLGYEQRRQEAMGITDGQT
jgi:hypothetical protein